MPYKILTRQQLKDYIAADRDRYTLRRPSFLGWFLGDESYVVVKYLMVFRKLEYYTNIQKKNPLQKVKLLWYLFRHRRMRIKTGIYLNLNSVGPGLYIPHFAGGIYANGTIGKNCIISSGCVLGAKTSVEARPIIGDDVEICIGAKVIGNVKVLRGGGVSPQFSRGKRYA